MRTSRGGAAETSSSADQKGHARVDLLILSSAVTSEFGASRDHGGACLNSQGARMGSCEEQAPQATNFTCVMRCRFNRHTTSKRNEGKKFRDGGLPLELPVPNWPRKRAHPSSPDPGSLHVKPPKMPSQPETRRPPVGSDGILHPIPKPARPPKRQPPSSPPTFDHFSNETPKSSTPQNPINPA